MKFPQCLGISDIQLQLRPGTRREERTVNSNMLSTCQWFVGQFEKVRTENNRSSFSSSDMHRLLELKDEVKLNKPVKNSPATITDRPRRQKSHSTVLLWFLIQAGTALKSHDRNPQASSILLHVELHHLAFWMKMEKD